MRNTYKELEHAIRELSEAHEQFTQYNTEYMELETELEELKNKPLSQSTVQRQQEIRGYFPMLSQEVDTKRSLYDKAKNNFKRELVPYAREQIEDNETANKILSEAQEALELFVEKYSAYSDYVEGLSNETLESLEEFNLTDYFASNILDGIVKKALLQEKFKINLMTLTDIGKIIEDFNNKGAK